jgi:hypothetical protein
LDLRGSGFTDRESDALSHFRTLKKLRLAGTVDRVAGPKTYFGSQALASLAPLTALESLEVNGEGLGTLPYALPPRNGAHQ